MTAELASIIIVVVASKRWWCVAVAASMAAGCSSSASPPAASELPSPSSLAQATTLVTVAPEPTGVPGLGAADPFCAAWAGYGGTVQALAVASSFGDMSADQLAALELTAAPLLTAAIAGIGTAWPTELATERSVVVDGRLAAYARRAQRGVDALTSAGLTEQDMEALRVAWQTALETRDPESPTIAVPPLDPTLQTGLDAAARDYNAAVTPLVQDPSLSAAAVSAPTTSSYLAANCPDLAASGIGDAL